MTSQSSSEDDDPVGVTPSYDVIELACDSGDISTLERMMSSPRFSLRDTLSDEALLRVVEAAIRSNREEVLAVIFPRHLDPSILIPAGIMCPWSPIRVTPLFLLLFKGRHTHLNMLSYLLEAGSRMSCVAETDGGPLTALQIMSSVAVYMNPAYLFWEEKVTLLLDRGAQSGSWDELLEAACYRCSPRVVGKALVQGASPNNGSPLHTSLNYPGARYTVLVSLLSQGTGQSDEGSISIFLCPDDHLIIVSLLLEKGADPNRRVHSGLTAGHCVSCGDKPTLYRLLLEHGLDLHATDEKGWSALHYAVYGDDLESVKVLVEAGARLDVATHDQGYLPMHMAAPAAKPRFFSLGNSWEPDIVAYTAVNVEVMRHLVMAGAFLDARTPDGHTTADIMFMSSCPPWPLPGAIKWLLKQPIRLPYSGCTSLLAPHLDSLEGWVLTDCLLAAGFMEASFVKAHLTIAMAANSWSRYRRAARANPYVISCLDLDKLTKHNEEGLVVMYEHEQEEYDTYYCREDLCSELKVEEKVGQDVCEHVKREHRVVPLLMDIVVYKTRNYLLETNNNTTLYTLINRLPLLPDAVRNDLHLE